MLEILQQYITLTQCKNNKTAYISNETICCQGPHNKRAFRYNSKIKIGKCFACGFFFRNERTLLKQINKNLNKDLKCSQCTTKKDRIFSHMGMVYHLEAKHNVVFNNKSIKSKVKQLHEFIGTENDQI